MSRRYTIYLHCQSIYNLHWTNIPKIQISVGLGNAIIVTKDSSIKSELYHKENCVIELLLTFLKTWHIYFLTFIIIKRFNEKTLIRLIFNYTLIHDPLNRLPTWPKLWANMVLTFRHKWVNMSPLDDQLWMPFRDTNCSLVRDRTISINKFRVHAHEQERMNRFIILLNECHPVIPVIHHSVCACLWHSEGSCCQRSRDGCWINSHNTTIFIEKKKIILISIIFLICFYHFI